MSHKFFHSCVAILLFVSTCVITYTILLKEYQSKYISIPSGPRQGLIVSHSNADTIFLMHPLPLDWDQ